MNLPFEAYLYEIQSKRCINCHQSLSWSIEIVEKRNITNATTTDTKNLTSTTTNNKDHIVINEKNTSEEDRKTLLSTM